MKTITVAKHEAAMEALDYDTARPDQLWEYDMEQGEFDVLRASGLLDQINEICGSMIDDFEDEAISDPDKLLEVLVLLNNVKETFPNRHTITAMIDLFEKARQHETAVHFYF